MEVLKKWLQNQLGNSKLAWAIIVVLALLFGIDLTNVTPPPVDTVPPPVVDVQE
jgi:hypothetical protein